jgi:hypothetical protein
MGEEIGEALGCLATIAIIGIISFIVYTGYFIYDKTGIQTYESKVIVKPDYRLESKGKKIDTMYIYRFKN